jgi:hypothetical protein
MAHFWDSDTTSFAKIWELYRRGPIYTYEDPVWHAWAAICDVYFPGRAARVIDSRWAVDREAYRGGAYHQRLAIRPDIIVLG